MMGADDQHARCEGVFWPSGALGSYPCGQKWGCGEHGCPSLPTALQEPAIAADKSLEALREIIAAEDGTEALHAIHAKLHRLKTACSERLDAVYRKQGR